MFTAEVVIAFVFLISVVCFTEANVFTPQQETDVVNFINHIITCRNIPGLTVSVVAGSKTWAKGFGVADILSRRPVDEKTIFSIGSLGKAFTATLLGSHMNKYGYDWNTKLSDIKEADYEFVTDDLTKNATIADLLSHRTGLSDSTDYGFLAGYPPEATRDLLARRMKYIPKREEFRQTFIYNNFMYMLIGDIIEKLEKDNFESLVNSQLFEPIGMVSSIVSSRDTDVTTGNVAKPVIAKEKGGEFEEGNYKIYNMSPIEPAGTIMSNAVDMAKWMRFILNNGTTDDGIPLINSSRLNDMFQVHMTIPWYSLVLDLANTTFPINDRNTGYGFGWFISNYRGHRRYWHSGSLFSYVSYLWLFPDQDLGIYTNANGPGHNHAPGDTLRVIMYYIADILLGEEPWLSNETGCSFPSPWRATSSSFTPIRPEPVDTPPLTEYVGNYGNKVFPDVTISVINGILSLAMNRIKGHLHPTDAIDKFQLEITEPWELAIEKIVNENYTMMSSFWFTRDKHNITISFDWHTDTWITFKKGVYLLDKDSKEGGISKASTYSLLTCNFMLCITVVLSTLQF